MSLTTHEVWKIIVRKTSCGNRTAHSVPIYLFSREMKNTIPYRILKTLVTTQFLRFVKFYSCLDLTRKKKSCIILMEAKFATTMKRLFVCCSHLFQYNYITSFLHIWKSVEFYKWKECWFAFIFSSLLQNIPSQLKNKTKRTL